MNLSTLIDNGDATNRVDVIFMGDGYTANELDTTYRDHVNGFVTHMFSDNPLTAPFHQYRNFFNVHIIDVVSNESGVDDPNNNIVRDTALGATYNWDGQTDRLLYVNNGTTTNIMNDALDGTDIGAEMRFVTTNSTKYGGGGGYFAVYAGGNSNAHDVALHEIGHSFADLDDEYFTNGVTYSGGEPGGPNSTIDPNGTEWSHWLGFDDPHTGVVDVYEGSSYAQFGAYRPSQNSKMRSLNTAFDPIAKEAFVLQFYAYVDPLDDWTGKGGSLDLTDPDPLQVQVIDNAVIDVDWYLNGTLQDTAHVTESGNDITFDYKALNLAGGTYELEAFAFDVSGLVRRDVEETQQSIVWQLTVAGPNIIVGTLTADVLIGTDADDQIDALDGNDILFGSLGDDVLSGMLGADRVDYSNLLEAVTVNLFGSVATGESGWTDALRAIEHATGTNFDDTLTGGPNNTKLYGLGGNDTLNGLDGNNMLDGGQGNDLVNGGTGNELLLGGRGEDTLLGFAGNDALHGGADADLVSGGSGADEVYGNGGNDKLLGGSGDDFLGGGAGSDEMRGGTGADTLRGSYGGDALFGGGGADTLFGGRGNDLLTGGDGSGADDGAQDIFVFDSAAQGGGGIDRITDFMNGSDVIDLTAFGYTKFITQVLDASSDTDAGLRIDFENGDVLFVETLTKAEFDVSDVLL